MEKTKQKDYRLTETMRSAILPDMDKYRGGDGDTSNWKTNFHTPALDDCFQELRIYGWAAEKDWTCCNNCGRAEMEEYFGNNKPYVFYHFQSAENLNETGSVYLNYGVVGATDNLIIKKAKKLYETLKAYNLNPEWDGTLYSSIKITVSKRSYFVVF